MDEISRSIPPQDGDPSTPEPPTHEPVFNLPGVVTLAIALMVAIEVARQYLLSSDAQSRFLYEMAFVPARYGPDGTMVDGAWFWSPVTYSLLHGGWLHLIVNSFWLAAFGAIVARRIGTRRFVLFWIGSAVAAALVFSSFHRHEFVVMVGASGVVSALMGAAVRFAFPRHGRFNRLGAHLNPRLSIIDALTNRSVFAFLAIWFGINLLAAVGVAPGAGQAAIAWEAHVGGLLFGFFAFVLFDPVASGPGDDRETDVQTPINLPE